MCGISCSIYEDIRPIHNQQGHRGPDGNSIWCEEGRVSLGHNRLAVVDLSDEGAQPMQSDRYVLTFNGEIYNYKNLRTFLEAPYNRGNDAYTLLHYIEKYGLDVALRDINGMFAFILFDRIENLVYAVVDRFAQKPLYWISTANGYAFASSPAALLHLQDKWEINPSALSTYWALGSVQEDSIFKGIKKVPAATVLTICPLGSTFPVSYRYWEPQFQQNTDLIEYFIKDAIDKVKEADVPVYIFLSGGIDSTLVASRCHGMNAIHMDSPEVGYAIQAARKFNINLIKVNPRSVNPLAAIEDYSRKCGEPSMAGIIPWITSQEAAQYCKVAISANGADELFFGYDRTSQDITQHQIDHIFRKGFERHYPDPIDPRLSSGRWLELMTYVQQDLNKTLDFAAMSHSLEVRAPFLDHRLVEMALSIPQQKHGRKDLLKTLLKRQGFSDQFLNRPKLGFSLYKEPPDYGSMKLIAMKWCIENGYLKVPEPLSKRDKMYLEASAIGFYGWWRVWNRKLKNNG
jgi:asparagine synthase (glutamine-hydrolysing)